MHVEEHQPEFAATGSGGLGIDDTTLFESVEPSLFAGAVLDDLEISRQHLTVLIFLW